ncbi:hypothetical protein Q5P01_000990 [Channa striata]|uniref:Uncharacterized protein n=1 Tax=Channa striata TaxID=64152 RepID=A0AA88IHL7_CHASR|nr:hypothetical protein Q5P01_000990 [Channa striata]
MKGGHSGDTASKAAECAEMLTRQPPVDINKIQKMWYTLSKGDSAKDKDVYANVKVLFLKPAYHNKLKKLQPPESDSRATTPLTAPLTRGQENPVERLQSRGSSAVTTPWPAKGRVTTAGGFNARRTRAPTALGGPLPAPECSVQPTRILGEWVASNRGVVITPESGLEGSTQRSPTDRLDSLSTERWSEKALLAFPDKAGRRLSHAPREEKRQRFWPQSASSATPELKKSRPVSRAPNDDAIIQGRKAPSWRWKSELGKGRRTKGGQMPRRAERPTKHRFRQGDHRGRFRPRSAATSEIETGWRACS